MTTKNSTEDALSAELGRKKSSNDPADHLRHLINIGWDPESKLIRQYVLKNSLQSALPGILALPKRP